jgi:hypothetical protein
VNDAEWDYDGYISHEFRREYIRLRTFDPVWEISFKFREKLAASGFYWLSYQTFVKCYFCDGVLGNWEETDEPDSKHLNYFPFCKFIRNRATDNILIANDLNKMCGYIPPFIRPPGYIIPKHEDYRDVYGTCEEDMA